MSDARAEDSIDAGASAGALAASLDAALPVLVLVDPMVGEPLGAIEAGEDETETQRMREATWRRPVLRVPLSPRIALPLHQHPYMLTLEGPADPLLEFTLELAHDERTAAMANGLAGQGASPHRIGGWLQTRQPAATVAAELSEIFRLRVFAATSATYLRLADRRVLALLRHVVGDARVAGNLPSIEHWIYLDVLGGLSVLKGGSGEGAHLRLTGPEWARMECGQGINRTIAQRLGEMVRVQTQGPVCESMHELYSRVERAFGASSLAAKQFPDRFPTLIDRTVYAALSLLYPHLPRCEAAVALLGAPAAEETPPEPMRDLWPAMAEILSAARPVPSNAMQ